MPRVQTRLDSCTGFVNAISPHLVWRSSRATPSRRVSDSSATPHFSALPKGSGGWDFSRRSRRALFASGSALRSFGGLLGRPPFPWFRRRRARSTRRAGPSCLVTGPGAPAKTGRTASSSGFYSVESKVGTPSSAPRPTGHFASRHSALWLHLTGSTWLSIRIVTRPDCAAEASSLAYGARGSERPTAASSCA